MHQNKSFEILVIGEDEDELSKKNIGNAFICCGMCR